jgi:hypothetical protein
VSNTVLILVTNLVTTIPGLGVVVSFLEKKETTLLKLKNRASKIARIKLNITTTFLNIS